MGSNPVAVTWRLVALFSTVLISILRTVNCHSTGFLQAKHQLGLGVEENGWKLSTEVTGIDGLQKEYQKSVNIVATSSQMDKNLFGKVKMEKSILTRESNDFKLRIMDSLLIARDKPILKKADSSLSLELF